MKGRIYDFAPDLRDIFLTWLKPLGLEILDQREHGTHYGIKADFGKFFEFLLAEGGTSGLIRLMRQIPVAEVPRPLWHEWKRTKSPHLDTSLDRLIDQGILQHKKPEDVVFRENYRVTVTFDRTYPSVEVEFDREWDNPQTVFLIAFEPKRVRTWDRRMRVSASFQQDTFVGVGKVIYNLMTPKGVKSLERMNAIFDHPNLRTP